MENRIPVKSEKIASRIIDSEAIIVLLEKQQTIILNEVGSYIWEIIDGKRNISELTQIISSEFDITYEEALNDIVEFIEDMTKRGAILIK